MKTLAVFISGSGSNLQSLIDHVGKNTIPANIACVISNNPSAYGIERAEKADINTHIIDHRKFADRRSFEFELLSTLKVYEIDLILLAGFMRILSKEFVDNYAGKVINIHPSLLPKFTGLRTHQRAIETKETEHGCSTHFVTEELDNGPLILQAKVPVKNTDNEQSLAARVLDKEHIIYPLTVKWFCEDRLSCSEKNIIFDGLEYSSPIILNESHIHELR